MKDKIKQQAKGLIQESLDKGHTLSEAKEIAEGQRLIVLAGLEEDPRNKLLMPEVYEGLELLKIEIESYEL